MNLGSSWKFPHATDWHRQMHRGLDNAHRQAMRGTLLGEALLPFRFTPAVISEVPLWRFAEVGLREPKYLFLIQMVDVDTNVSYQLRSNIPMVLLDVRDPLVRGIGFAFAITEDENGSRWPEFCGDFGPVSRIVIFVGPRRIPGLMVNLVEPSVRVGSDQALRAPANVSIRCIDQRVPIGNDNDHILATYGLLVLISQRVLSSQVPRATIAESRALRNGEFRWVSTAAMSSRASQSATDQSWVGPIERFLPLHSAAVRARWPLNPKARSAEEKPCRQTARVDAERRSSRP